jgi:hypothetical protein
MQLNVNRGTGAGGANTNIYGKQFERKTNPFSQLSNNGFKMYKFSGNPTTKTQSKMWDYLCKIEENKKTIFMSQYAFKKFMKRRFGFSLFRCPDEAYLIIHSNGKKVLKILEKKEQNRCGSVETKLWASPSLKREYELILGNGFEVHYALCVNQYLQTKLSSDEKKYKILNAILSENDIPVLFGDEENYHETLNMWLNQ